MFNDETPEPRPGDVVKTATSPVQAGGVEAHGRGKSLRVPSWVLTAEIDKAANDTGRAIAALDQSYLPVIGGFDRGFARVLRAQQGAVDALNRLQMELTMARKNVEGVL